MERKHQDSTLSVHGDFLADCTVRSAIGIILLSVCPSVRLSVCDAVHSDSQGWCTRLKVAPVVPSTHVPICPLRHFCCRMYRLATKCTTKNELTRVRNAISVYGTQAGSRLVCQQWHGAVEQSHCAMVTYIGLARCERRLQVQTEVCGLRIADADPQ